MREFFPYPTYGYDKAGNRLTETITRGGVSFRAGSFTYDKLDRLATAEYATRSLAYTYDAEGNRLTETITENSVVKNRLYSYNVSNQLLTVTENGQPAASFSYDLSGNVISLTEGEVTTNFEYDLRQQLLRVTKQQTNAPPVIAGEYEYDFAKRRIGRNGIRSVYEGDEPLTEWTIDNGQLTVLNQYTNGSDLIHTTKTGNAFGDAQGSVTLTDDGATSKRTEYGAFGEVRATDNAESAIGYTGQFYDLETDLQPLGNGERYFTEIK